MIGGARAVAGLGNIARVTGVALDLADPSAPAVLVQQALDVHGRVDVLVDNVGAVRLRLGGFLEVSDDDFLWAMEMNVLTAVRATRAALVPMIAQGYGAIVNIAFYQPDGATVDYGAAKAAVLRRGRSDDGTAAVACTEQPERVSGCGARSDRETDR